MAASTSEMTESTSITGFLRSRLAKFAGLCLLLLAVIGMSLAATSERKRSLHEYEATLRSTVDGLATQLENTIEFRRRSVRFLGDVPPIQGIVRASKNNGQDSQEQSSLQLWQQRLSQIFSAFLATNPEVYQVRYIGIADGGRELVRVERVDGPIRVTPTAELQKKGGRDYFMEAIRQPPGETYVSQITLNREHEKVEVPHRPTARIAVPVYEDGGPVFGIVVINVDVEYALQSFAKAAPPNSAIYVTNAAGGYFVHPQPGRAFGFEFGSPYRWQNEFRSTQSDHAPEGQGDIVPMQTDKSRVWTVTRTVSPQTDNRSRDIIFHAVVPDRLIQQHMLIAVAKTAGFMIAVGAVGSVLIFLYWVGVQRQFQARRERLRLAAIVDNSHDAIIGLDPFGTVSNWNQAAERLFGYSQYEATGRPIQSLIAPDEAPISETRELMRIIEGGSATRFETRRRHKDGHLIDVAATLSPIRGDQNNILGVAAILRDISDQKAAQAEILQLNANLESQVRERTAELEATSALQRAILVNAGYAIFAMDAAGTITLFNPAAESMLGYRENDVVGRRSALLFHDANEIAQRLEKVGDGVPPENGFELVVARAREEPAVESEWTYVRRDGSTLPVRLHISSLRDEQHKLVGYLGIAIDQTEFREREQALNEARAAAESANQAKSQFLANMSHEIRTPMNAVLGMLQLLRRTPLDFTQQDYSAKAESAAQTLLGILNDILDISKIEANKLTLDPHPFQLDDLLREVGVILSANVGQKEVEILFDIDPKIPNGLVGDALRLQQILLNLAGNAVKFTTEGEVVLSASLLRTTATGLDLEFRIRDTGIGMTEDQVGRIFDSFEQAESSVARRFGGTGLGLAITQKLVNMMGGTVNVESQAGVGSIFQFQISLAPAPDEAPAAPAAPATDRKACNLHKLRVLIVDDNSSAREILAAIAESFGWTADTAKDGVEALAILEAMTAGKDNYDVIFIDWRMPNMDGWTLSERINERRAGAAGPPLIIMATAYGRDALAQRLGHERAALDGMLVKPITASMLFDAVADASAGLGRVWQETGQGVSSTHRLQGMHILLAEDNATNQQVARELLGSEGAVVTVANNGLECIEVLRRVDATIDVVLMDIQMPELDGYGATRRIREELALDRLPIIAMTANALPSDRADCLAAGMNDHVGKPFHIDDLVSVLRFHWRGPADAAAQAPQSSESAPDTGTSGFDFKRALERLGGRRDLFVRESRAFVEQQTETPSRLRALVQSGNGVGAAQILHALKGVAATLGAQRLAALAASLEASINQHHGLSGLASTFGELEDALNEARQALRTQADALAPPDHPAAMSQPTSRAVSASELDTLMKLLAENNMRAISAAQALKSGILAIAPEPGRRLGEAMASLDFAGALEACRDIQQKLDQ